MSQTFVVELTVGHFYDFDRGEKMTVGHFCGVCG